MPGYIFRLIVLISLSSSIIFSDPYKQLNIDFLEENSPKKGKSNSKGKKNDKTKKKAFKEVIKGFEKIEGLFTFYLNEAENKAFMAIKPQQLGEVYLAGITRQSGDAYRYDGSSMLYEYPFFLKKVGEKIQFVEKNVKFRADKESATHRSIENQISNSIIATSKIEGEPEKETGAILVNANGLFLRDIADTGSGRNASYSFDKSNSYFELIKSFPYNTEIGVALHFTSKNPRYVFTLADSKSAIHRYHVSLSVIPESDYEPRIADDRVGHFLTIYQDYSSIYQETPYVRFVNRWHLEKAEPKQVLSKPKKPIIYWLENTIPVEFREAIREGILAWNEAFEAIGFKDAIVVKQMPDDADWDPADVRYSTVRWIIQPGSAYAVGPSRANPYTGELYDADIRVSADYVRFYYNDFMEFIGPVVSNPFAEAIQEEEHYEYGSGKECRYGENIMQNLSFSWNTLSAKKQISDEDRQRKLDEFIHNALVDLLLHEVGHTLGLRHNFKASSIYSLEQLSDSDFTAEHGTTGSVMDYNASNLLDGGHTFFQTKPGPYDYWAIEYAYTEQSWDSKVSESEFLNQIASKSTNPLLVYGTDEDTFGTSLRSIDPYTSSRDLSSDPIGFYGQQLDFVEEFWDDMLDEFEKEGERYPRIKRIFTNGLWEYYIAALNVSKFIGGIKHSRHHVGEKTENPFVVISADEQRRALKFLRERIIAPEVFDFPPDLLNKLAPERLADFRGSVWRMSRLDFPIHQVIKQIQTLVLYRVYDPRLVMRVQDNELRFDEGEDVFTMEELFSDIVSMTWDELEEGKNVNSFRRNLQAEHVNILTLIMLNEANLFPNDAVALVRNNLNNLYKKLKYSLENDQLDEYTYTHYQENANRIYSVYKAQTVLN